MILVQGHANLASAFKDAARQDAAIASYRRALVLRPDFPEAFANLVHSLQVSNAVPAVFMLIASGLPMVDWKALLTITTMPSSASALCTMPSATGGQIHPTTLGSWLRHGRCCA